MATTKSFSLSQDQANSGGAVPPFTAGKNKIINGDFGIWQRGTSSSSGGYFADRWTNLSDYSSVTATQQSSGAPTGSRYFLRLTSTAGSSYWSSYQMMETSTIAPLWGQNATFSAKFRRNSTMTVGMNLFIQKSATVDAGSGATWTTVGTVSIANASMPTGTTSADWYTASTSVAIPNDGTANSLRLIINYAAGAANGSTVDIAQIQLEAGSVATPFTTATGTIQGELAACQRYYTRIGGSSAASSTTFGLGFAGSVINSTQCTVTGSYPAMRTAPSFAYSGTIAINSAGQNFTVTSVGGNYLGKQAGFIDFTLSAASMTAGRGCALIVVSDANAYIEMSAEL